MSAPSTSPSAPERHVAVVGGGVFGTAAALELRRRGWRVTLLDPGPIPHPHASSTDVSKVVRMDYGADTFYHELAERALEGWRRWNRASSRPLFHETGFLLLTSRPMRPGSFEFESFRTLRARGYAPVRYGDLPEGRFPAWSREVCVDGYFNPVAGWAESGAVVAFLLDRAQRMGVRTARCRALHLRRKGGRIVGVSTTSGDVDADAVVVAAGAWTPTLVPELADRLRPVAQPVVHLRVGTLPEFEPPRFPVWAADLSTSGWYGFPVLPDGALKIGHHGPGRRTHPDARGAVGEEHLAALRAFVARWLPSVASAPVAHTRVCMYCDAFDGDLWVDRDPDVDGLVVASGGSGHGFKFAPLLGPMIADAVEGRPRSDGGRFAWRAAGGTRFEAARAAEGEAT